MRIGFSSMTTIARALVLAVLAIPLAAQSVDLRLPAENVSLAE